MALEQRGQELQAFIQRLSVDLQNVSPALALAGCLSARAPSGSG